MIVCSAACRQHSIWMALKKITINQNFFLFFEESKLYTAVKNHKNTVKFINRSFMQKISLLGHTGSTRNAHTPFNKTNHTSNRSKWYMKIVLCATFYYCLCWDTIIVVITRHVTVLMSVSSSQHTNKVLCVLCVRCSALDERTNE